MASDIQLFLDKLPGSAVVPGRVCYINNPDGTARWIWPAELSSPDFLCFYNASNLKAKLFVAMVQLVFFLRLQRVFFPVADVRLPVLSEGRWSLFTGTNGLTRKMVVHTGASFLKIPLGEWAAKSLKIESEALQYVESKGINTFGYPAPLDSMAGCHRQSKVTGTSRVTELTTDHIAMVREIFSIHSAAVPFTGSALDIAAEQNLSRLATSSRMPVGLLKKLQYLQLSLHGLQRMETGAAHGDFTPWNMVMDHTGRFFIYDWESFILGKPKGFDAIHFIMQQSILVERKPWKEIYNVLAERLVGKHSLFATAEEMETYLRLYLLVHVSSSMVQYAGMQHWHTQVYWMTDTWNTALDALKTSPMDDRQHLILSLADHLMSSPYAGLKIPGTAPESWPSDSDIDLVTDSKTMLSVIDFCKSHARVARADIRRRSHMAGIFLWMEDGGTLAIDLIMKLQRKSTVFMDAASVIDRAVTNHHGIKVASDCDNARYITWFFALNHAAVPARYRHYSDHIAASSDPADRLLTAYINGDHSVKGQLKVMAAGHPQNKGLQKPANFLAHMADTFRDLIRFDGMMITFSGVDGAGKSTIIDEITAKIQKALRKEVVVLRHRPSVLPIISALKYGKAQAEAISVSKLPRTGNNHSLVSSLLRFAYYYADYFFGQFYIYFRYVCRGKVVLYDRYYFDFINDSRRSNIVLPARLVKLGYSLLIKPDLNYFLYAEPEVILSRKKELDAATIEILTGKYRDLFDELSHTYSNSRYISLNNVVKDETLSTMFCDIKSKMTAA